MESVTLADEIVSHIPEVKLLHSMHEDRGTASRKIVLQFLTWLEELFPGEYLMIMTGGLITLPCEHQYPCEDYASDWNIYLLKMSVWQKCAEHILEENTMHRKNQCRFIVKQVS